jgi:hypothetical protein
VAETNINKKVEVYIVNLTFPHLETWLHFYVFVRVSISPADVLNSFSDNSKGISCIVLLRPYL